jgi:hypothetical protein
MWRSAVMVVPHEYHVAHGPSCRFAAVHQFIRFQSEADILEPRQNRIYEYAP